MIRIENYLSRSLMAAGFFVGAGFRNSSDGMLFQFGCRPQSIHLREKNIAGSTERSEDANASSKLAEENLRFSMKIMFAPAFDILLHSV